MVKSSQFLPTPSETVYMCSSYTKCFSKGPFKRAMLHVAIVTLVYVRNLWQSMKQDIRLWFTMVRCSLSSTLSSVKHILQDVNCKAQNRTCKQPLRFSRENKGLGQIRQKLGRSFKVNVEKNRWTLERLERYLQTVFWSQPGGWHWGWQGQWTQFPYLEC